MKSTIIAIASDHHGVELKSTIIKYLKNLKIATIDLGPDASKEMVDYPVFAKKVVESILQNKATYGVLICNSGLGMSIAANRYKGIRAALCPNVEYAELARMHNNANIIVFGKGYISTSETLSCIDTFLKTDFKNDERHVRRIKMLDQ